MSDGSDQKLPVPYQVGYGKPPAEHRFRKGQSGNPNGRPRTARKANAATFDPASQPTERLILEEAYRPVTIREGDKTIELPAIQAAVRALAISAMKGSRLSQKTLAELVRGAEAIQRTETIASMEAAIDYKQKWTAHLEGLRARGLAEPALVPHPDDLMVDLRNGGVKVLGPLTDEEKEKQDAWIARRDDAQAEVTYYAEAYRKARTPKKKELMLEWWHAEQRIFDMINDTLKGRYKKALANRSHREGASREGQAIEEYLADRRRPKQLRQWS